MNFGGPGRASFRSLKLGAGENRLNSKFCRARLSSSPAPLALPRRHSAAHMPSLASLRRQGTAHLRCSSAWPRGPLLLAYLTVAASCSLLISSPLLLAQHSSLPIFASELAESPLLSSELTIEPRLPCVPGHRLSCLLLAWYGHALHAVLLHAMCGCLPSLCHCCVALGAGRRAARMELQELDVLTSSPSVSRVHRTISRFEGADGRLRRCATP
jgi:hypothetical protein